MYDADYKVLMQLKACRDKLKPQQYRTIRGQIFSGDTTVERPSDGSHGICTGKTIEKAGKRQCMTLIIRY